MSAFAGLNIGLSALHAARKGLDTTGHNIANANTAGYSRQRVDLSSAGGATVPAFFSKGSGTGQGVIAGDTHRLRNVFLEVRALQEHGAAASLETTKATLVRVEAAFAEPGPNGLQSQLSDFWSSWDEVANRPGDLAGRSQVLEQAQTLVTSIRQAANDLVGLAASNVEQIQARIGEVNALAERVADLNNGIRDGVNAGTTPNDLMDQRDALVLRLADLIGATARPDESGSVDVYINGTALVRGSRVDTLAVTQPSADTVQVVWAAGGADTQVVNGTVGGMVDAVNTQISTYRDQLDQVTAALVSATNAFHAGGFDLAGVGGLPFFVATAGREGETIALNPALVGRPELLAASASSTPGNLDGSRAQLLAEAATSAGAPDPMYRSMIDGLGVATQRAIRRVDIQNDITGALDAARESESGVNLDEEMTQMLAFQHAYDAAARFVTAIDSALDTLIKGTGLVGR